MATITNEFNAFRDVTGATANQPGFSEERKLIAAGPIAAFTAVCWEVSGLSPTGTGLRVGPPGAADAMGLVGVAQQAAAVAGDEITVVTYGVAKLQFQAVVALSTAFGVNATTGTGKAAGTATATVKNLGYTLETTSVGGVNWVFICPGVGF